MAYENKLGLSHVMMLALSLAGGTLACAGETGESIDDSESELQAEIDTPWVKCTRPQDDRGCTVYYAKDVTGLAWTWGLGKGYVPRGTVLTAAARAQGSYLVLGMQVNGRTEYNVDAPAGAVRVVDTMWTDEAGSPDASKEWRRGRREQFTASAQGGNAFVAPPEARSEAVDDALGRIYCNDPNGCAVGYTHWLGRSVPLAKKATCGDALPVVVRSTHHRQYVVSTPMLKDLAESDPRFGRVKVVSMDDRSWGTTPAECPGTAPGFVCETQAQFEPPPASGQVAQLVDVRVGKHEDYDRFVMEFSNGLPGFAVTRHDRSDFGPVDVAGEVGLSVAVSPASAYENGQPTYDGPKRFRGGPTMREAASVQDVGGTIMWGLGLSKAACFRVLKLSNPPRLVVDVKH